MAVTYGFYNSLGKDRVYNAEQMSAIFDGVITDGVFASIGGKLIPTAGSGMQVIVKPGKCWFNSTWTVNDSELPLSIPAADVSLTRIDAIVVRVNSAINTRANSIAVVKGTASANPVKPTLASNPTLHQYALGYVTVPANATSISASNIEVNVGKSTCPFVTSVLQQTNIDDLFNQWNSQFLTWFNNVQSQLSGNVAANLQAQIDAIAQNGYGKNGVVSAITITDIDQLYSGLDTLLANMKANEEKRVTIAVNSSTAWPYGGGTWECNLRRHTSPGSPTWETATIYGYWDDNPVVVLTRNGTKNTWTAQSLAKMTDIHNIYAIGDIKLTQAHVNENIWTKCDGRSLNANSAPLSELYGKMTGVAVEKIIPFKDVFGGDAEDSQSQYDMPFWYIGNEIAYIRIVGDDLKIFFYDVDIKSTRSVLIKSKETTREPVLSRVHGTFRANNKIFFSCELKYFLGIGDTAQCIFCSADNGETWVYSVINTSNYYTSYVTGIQWCPILEKYIFQIQDSGNGNYSAHVGIIGTSGLTGIEQVTASKGFNAVFYNPATKKFIKFYWAKTTDGSAGTLRLYYYETSNINDTGASVSNPVLIDTISGNNSDYLDYEIQKWEYMLNTSDNKLYIILDIQKQTARNTYADARKIIDVSNRRSMDMPILNSKGNGVHGFGESYEAVAMQKDASDNYQMIYGYAASGIPVQTLETSVQSMYSYMIDHYAAYKYLGVWYKTGFIFMSAPNAQNNQVIQIPKIDDVSYATYYMKVANEEL